MPKITYVSKKFTKQTLQVIENANDIIEEYMSLDFSLTLRQLYYQFVSRDIFPESWFDEDVGSFNSQRNYKKLGSVISNGRMAGLIDWRSIEDRTRNVKKFSHWTSPSDIIETCISQYRIDRWDNQQYRPCVWIEKEALIGVIEGVCKEFDVPHFACKGYTSISEMWSASQIFKEYIERGQTPVMLHFGDHDPSGIDMTRDIADRLETFMGGINVSRLALNFDQIQKYKPPPNPAKTLDSRYKAYVAEYGTDSWELDAMGAEDHGRSDTNRIVNVS